MTIHASAIVDPNAEIDSSVEIGPFSIIGPNVSIDAGTVVKSHVVINGCTTIGKNNQIFQFASVGEANQDKKYQGEPTELVIGDNNSIRDSVTLHRGTVQDKGVTIIGNGNLFMACSHVGHDCIVGDNNVFANYVALAGHVTVGDFVILGGYTGIHQFCQISSYSMCGMGSMVNKDIPQYIMVSGEPAKAHGMNFEGMRRRGMPKHIIKALKDAYKCVYMKGLKLDDAITELENGLAKEYVEVSHFVNSIKYSTRGIIR